MLKPGEHWSHLVGFVNPFERQTEKAYRESVAKLRTDIQQKLERRPASETTPVAANEENVEPFLQLFDRLFLWHPGEYVISLIVNAEPGSASYAKKYRFTLYESDTAELKQYTDDYKHGGGITFPVERHTGVLVPLAEHRG